MVSVMNDYVEYTSSRPGDTGTVSRSTWEAMRSLAQYDAAHPGCARYEHSLGPQRAEVLQHIRKALLAVEGGGNECLLANLADALRLASRLR